MGEPTLPPTEALTALPPRRKGERRGLVLGIKIVVSVFLFAILFLWVDLAAFVRVFRQARGALLAFAMAVNVAALLVSTQKWSILLRGLTVSAPWWILFKHYTIGFFASTFLPGRVGGDVVRWQITGVFTGKPIETAASILAERVTGLFSLIFLSLAAGLFLVPEFGTGPVVALTVLSGVLLFFGSWLALARQVVVPVVFRFRRSLFGGIIRTVYRVHRVARHFSISALVSALLYSVGFYLVTGLVFYIVCLALGLPVTFIQATAVRLFVSLLTLLPISLGGLGLGQAGDVVLLGMLGVTPHAALGASIARLGINMAYSLLGGLLFLTWKPHGNMPGDAPSASASPPVEVVQ